MISQKYAGSFKTSSLYPPFEEIANIFGEFLFYYSQYKNEFAQDINSIADLLLFAQNIEKYKTVGKLKHGFVPYPNIWYLQEELRAGLPAYVDMRFNDFVIEINNLLGKSHLNDQRITNQQVEIQRLKVQLEDSDRKMEELQNQINSIVSNNDRLHTFQKRVRRTAIKRSHPPIKK